MHYIEGGWPGANPKDDEFFQRATAELDLTTSTLVAFGSTRRVKGKVDEDETLQHLVKANTSTVCIVGKAWDYHVTEALRTTLDEGVAMVADSIEFLKGHGLTTMYDAEHFFDGYKHNPEFALRVLEAATLKGCDCLVLCDTNGGSLPNEVEQIVREVVAYVGADVSVGVHLHDDTGCGVANALAGVRGGATQVQGTINGYGERTGNCNLTTIIPNLTLKMGVRTLPEGRMERLTAVSPPHRRAREHHAPSAAAVCRGRRRSRTRRACTSRPSSAARMRTSTSIPTSSATARGSSCPSSPGKSTLEMKAKELGLELDGKALNDVVGELKELEHRGYHFEAADGSLELLMRTAAGWEQPFFRLESFRVLVEHRAIGRVHHRGHDQVVGRRRAHHRDGRGQRSGQRARHRVAGGDRRPVPRARARPPDRLQGARARHAEGHGRGDPGAARLDRRRSLVVDDRGQREHHRGQLAGTGRLDRVRAAEGAERVAH